MADISVRNLDDGVRDRLRVRAAENGRSMEAEIRAILTSAVDVNDAPSSLFTILLERVAEVGGVELDLPARATPPRSVDLPT